MPKNVILHVEPQQDGTTIQGLRLGFMTVPQNERPWIEHVSEHGGFYPFEIVRYGAYKNNPDAYRYRVIHWRGVYKIPTKDSVG